MSAPLILGTNSIKDVGYNVDNSCRFDDGSSDHLSKTFSSSGSQQKHTFSVWVKRGNLGGGGKSLFGYKVDANNFLDVRFGSSDNLLFRNYNGGTYTWRFDTNRKFRDVSSWYHLVFAADSTQSTESNRFKLYVNGVQETSFSTSTYPSQNANLKWGNSAYAHLVGDTTGGDDFDGYMAEVVVIDNAQLDPTSFGEFDADTGIWKPIDVSGLTFGTNGFYLPFENSGALGQDDSGNGNNFTVNNLTSIDQTTDTPTNNYCTLNPLDNYYASSTFSEGNLKISTGGSNTTYNTSTFGLTQGKWYWEYKFTGTTQQYMTGIASKLSNATSDVLGYQHAEEYALNQSGSGIYSNSVTTNYGSGNLASGDIISVALDLDNNNLYFAKNGQWGSGSAWDQTFSTALAYSITDPASTTLGAYFVAVGEWNSSGTSEINMNFGNPPFTISSGNSDGNGMGNFEYAVPSGYYSLNTKNLAEFG